MPKPFICRKCGFDLELAPRHDCEPLITKPSQQAKTQAGMKLSEVSELTGVSPQTLANWHKHKQRLFKVLLMGCAVEKGKTHSTS